MRPKKRFGQHFLKSAEIIDKIVALIHPAEGQTIVEIGSGKGALTLPLAQAGASVIAVEYDREAVRYLSRTVKDMANIRLLHQDFLTFEPTQAGVERFTLVGNIPYHITSPLVEWIYTHRTHIERVVLMVQKELGARLAASPNSKDWSPLSIFTQLAFDVVKHFDVAARHFSPPPKVVSSVISLTPRSAVEVAYPDFFEEVVRAAFRHRRKLLVNNLVPDIIPTAERAHDIFARLGFPEKIRAEQLTIEQFLTLTNFLKEHTIS